MHKYLKNHILEELDGAVDYWNKAIQYKNNKLGKIFKSMAETELEHANSLLEIFNSLDSNSYIEEEMYEDILNAYGSAMYKIAQMERIYKKED